LIITFLIFKIFPFVFIVSPFFGFINRNLTARA